MSLTINGSGGGIPVGVPTIETGTYTGDGTYGSANPCSITFNGTPVFVLIAGNKNEALFDPLGMDSSFNNGRYWVDSANNVTSSQTYAKLEGKTLSWYNGNSTTTASGQMNRADTTYYWFAITI